MFGFSDWEKLKKHIENGQLDEISKLLDGFTPTDLREINRRFTNKEKMPPVLMAVRQKKEEIAQYLMTVTDENTIAFTLSLVAREGDIGSLKWLLDEGVSVDTTVQNNNWTPLHTAVFFNNIETARFLIKRGADVNSRASHLETSVLLTAVQNANLEMVKLLIENGADPYLESKKEKSGKDKNGNRLYIKITPIFWADHLSYKSKKYEDIASYLAKLGKIVDTILVQSTFGKDKQAQALELMGHLQLNAPLLQRVVENGKIVEIFEYLSYNNAKKLYRVVRRKVSGTQKQQIEDKIRQARQR